MPILPTVFVALAIVTMVALGLWQLLDRLPQKEAFIAQLAANPMRPPVVFPRVPDDRLLFRRSSVVCLPPVTIDRAGAGAAGFRLIARCRTAADGPGVRVQLGTTRDPRKTVAWPGGSVSGFISHAPDSRSLIAGLFDGRPRDMLLVADTPIADLGLNGRPDPTAVPNSHLAYAGQWFFFAASAAIIYALALRRRETVVPPPRGR